LPIHRFTRDHHQLIKTTPVLHDPPVLNIMMIDGFVTFLWSGHIVNHTLRTFYADENVFLFLRLK
jgi:hypothetical protein